MGDLFLAKPPQRWPNLVNAGEAVFHTRVRRLCSSAGAPRITSAQNQPPRRWPNLVNAGDEIQNQKAFQRLASTFPATLSLGTGCQKPMGAANCLGWCYDLLQVVARNWIRICAVWTLLLLVHVTAPLHGAPLGTSAAPLRHLCGTSAAPLQHLRGTYSSNRQKIIPARGPKQSLGF